MNFFGKHCVWVSAQGAVVSLNATLGLSESYELQEGDEYAAEEYGAPEGEQEEGYRADEYGDAEGMEYNTGGNEDEVLDLQINEPLDDEFQVSTSCLPFHCGKGERAVRFGKESELLIGL